MNVNKNLFLADLFQASMLNSSLGSSLSLECALLYMGFFLTLGMHLGLFAAALQCSASVWRAVRTVCCTKFWQSFPTPTNLIGTCGSDNLQEVVKSELPAGSFNNHCQEHPGGGKIDGFCLFISLFLWEGQAVKAILISSFHPLIVPQHLKQANRNE